MAEIRTRTEQSAPLLTAPNEVEEVKTRRLRAVNVSAGAESLTVRRGAGQIARERALPLPRRYRKPAIRQLEEALNGGDSPHHAYAELFETLAICLASGMSVPAALERAAQQAEPGIRQMCADVGAQVAAGVPIQAAFGRWQQQLPEVVLPLLEHGVQQGTLERASRRLAQVLKRFARLDERFAYSALRPDMTLPLLLCGTMPFMPFWIESLPVFIAYCTGCVGISLAVWHRRHHLARRKPRNLKAAKRALAKTRRGMTNRLLGTARWARTFATLYECGVPISAALEAAAPASCNPHYADALRRAAQYTREGRTLHDSLERTTLLPNGLLEEIRIGEMTGELGTSLDRFADMLEQRAMLAAMQRLIIQIVAGVFCIGGLATASLSPLVGIALIAMGMTITWLLFITGARSDP